MEIRGRSRKSREDKRGALIRVEGKEMIEVGDEGPKFIGEASVIRGQREKRAGQFFVKIITVGDASIGKVMDKYHWLKGRGLPVVPTLRYDKKNNTLLMTELSEGGKKILVDRHHPLSNYGIKTRQIKNWGELKRQVGEIAAAAYDRGKGMELSSDNYMLILDKTTRGYVGNICLVDIVYGANFLTDLAPDQLARATFEQNGKSAEEFIAEIQVR